MKKDIINREFVRRLDIPFCEALQPVTLPHIAEGAELSVGAVANAIHVKSTSPRAIAAAVAAIRQRRNLLDQFLNQFPQEFYGTVSAEDS